MYKRQALTSIVNPQLESALQKVKVEVKADPADCGNVFDPVSYTHLRAHETVLDLVCRLLLEKKKKQIKHNVKTFYCSD